MKHSIIRRTDENAGHKYHMRPSPMNHPMRAKSFTVVAVTIPDDVRLETLYFDGPRDQSSEGACTGFGTSEYEEIAWGSANKQKLNCRLSPAYLYARTRMAEHSWPDDAGATMADEFAVLHAFGVCPEDDMPYDVDPAEPIPNIADAAAAAFRCKEPAMVDMDSFDGAMRVLATGMPIGIAIPCYQSFEDCGSDGILPIPDPDKEALLGGHGLCICGYDKKRNLWRGINSWGTNWGDGGYFWMPFGYPLWEAWTAPL